ncbi:MAG: class I SAM-dependent rRNA methyltransferase [Spirochaetaceae bacterium]|jgi:23S rRNA (cytosine1962-C5)-methyltransferase|nr:class I SAM-dependent rRNA methyltransferase [Spirochaetaceae bacterium]
MKRIILKPGEEHRIALGHPWVYDNEIARVLAGRSTKARGRAEPGAEDAPDAELAAGEIADVESSRREYLGRAFVNPASKIRARIYSPSKEGFDKGFFKRRIREAAARRAADAGPDTNLAAASLRVLFGEADFLPGLIIDRYAGWPRAAARSCAARPLEYAAVEAALGPPASWLTLQFHARGADLRREEIIAAIEEVFSYGDPASAAPTAGDHILFTRIAGIIEKSVSPARELEGLPPREGIIAGDAPEDGILIFENGLPFTVNLQAGQKTGHFLDQKENRRRAAAFARGSVLDAFSYSGGFAVHAARLGRDARVTAVDISKTALETARENAALNGVTDRIAAVEADVFDYLHAALRRGEKYDLVILDPPAFAKSRAALSGAVRGYQEINSAALRLLRSGGVLVSCSCSQALDAEQFSRMIARSAAAADRRLIQIDFRFQGRDHPVRVGYGESLYLKCGFYRAI